ncbi:MAG: hypothetical protein QOI48_4000 [Solirubrobacteraceae bacterium]|jgi:hypothetical protein|nr:hypothetical protein [Solirubrobacteraceae bacterium]
MSRPYVALLVGSLLSLAAAPTAVGKEAVRAAIDISDAALQASAGTRISIGWTLTAPVRWPPGTRPTQHAMRKPFGASGLYVRLDSKSGGAPAIAYGHGPTGRYTATATVPEGGIGGIELGLEGVRTVAGKAPQRADVFFPIDNDPFATGAARDSGGAPPLLWIGWGLLVCIALIVGARRARRARRQHVV